MKEPKEKSILLAIGLNILLPGVGYMYMGRVIVGIDTLLLTILVYLSTPIIAFFFAWAGMNAIMAIDMVILGNRRQKAMLLRTTKKCPKCAELVKKEAVVCRYCGASLEEGDHMIDENVQGKKGKPQGAHVERLVMEAVILLLLGIVILSLLSGVAIRILVSGPTWFSGTSSSYSVSSPVYSGQGSKVVSGIYLPEGECMFTSQVSGQYKFLAQLLDKDSNLVGIIADAIGPINSVKSIRIVRAGTYAMNVTADGTWSITIKPY